ncbi:CheR family methyltransferase [Muricoccus radiodurans]|uniref:CheR family methyltransferase n=1 Tax=Muricoccus radiodurans TaxID=2231721 RepID=UPI003CF995AB
MEIVQPMIRPASETTAEAGLARLAGLAPSEVLRRRLLRAAPSEPLPWPPDLDHPAWAALLDAVTVGETRLFRSAPQLLALGALLPEAMARPLRLLSAGCATGEEAWSLAALAAASSRPAEILGLDLCRPALRRAEAARYPAGPPDALREVPEPFHRFFPREGTEILPRPGGSTQVSFRRANLLEPPPDLPRFDAILCRNVLIYLLPEARAAVLRGLADRLLPGGTLLLGPTDTVPPGLGLRAVDGVHAIWQRAP